MCIPRRGETERRNGEETARKCPSEHGVLDESRVCAMAKRRTADENVRFRSEAKRCEDAPKSLEGPCPAVALVTLKTGG